MFKFFLAMYIYTTFKTHLLYKSLESGLENQEWLCLSAFYPFVFILYFDMETTHYSFSFIPSWWSRWVGCSKNRVLSSSAFYLGDSGEVGGSFQPRR